MPRWLVRTAWKGVSRSGWTQLLLWFHPQEPGSRSSKTQSGTPGPHPGAPRIPCASYSQLIASSMPPLLAQLKRSLCELLANHQLSWGLSTFSQAPVSEDRWFQPGQVKSCLPATLADLDVVVVEISDVKKQVCSFCTCCRGWGRPSSRRRQ